VTRSRWGRPLLAVGDAAAALYLIAAQGIYEALMDGADVTKAIAAAVGRSEPLPLALFRSARRAVEDSLANRAHLYGLEQRWKSAPLRRQRAER
jgi:2-polyprenyl-6-methoxyphenol hydroxylase-like FAD-dependent oxidoreductase